jgi:16S rRNA (uracil1498-N3)-methyltransferase
MANRFYIGNIAAAAGEKITLSREESQHLIRVMRAAPGDRIAVFGNGREFSAKILSSDNGIALLELLEPAQATPPAVVRLNMVLPFLKGGKTEMLVQKLTEMGTASFTIYCAEREVAQGNAPKIAQLQRTAVEACKQCRRADVPKIEMADTLRNALCSTLSIVLHEKEMFSESLSAKLRRISSEKPASIDIATGPEGGFTDSEIASVAANALVTSLGPRILRAETAPLVAASIALAAFGEY